ncbi:response regulator [Massilia sp. TW-1]|uniref:histidine kinase n=1 Tax=Telluria antibiotica TaxID=2717319 RepID=A0ABX0PEI7_9BURK|nr:ATP-binding protein [Telluria antibiotica]NIA55527.1 response regulator [Telluria antibiotica]
MIRPRRSIREKLVTIVMSTTLAALVVSVGTVVAYDLRSYKHALLNDLATQAELVGHMTSAALAFDDARLAGENLALLRSRPSVRAAAIYDEHGALFATYVAPGEAGVFPVRPAKGGRPVRAGAKETYVGDGDELVLYKPISENGDLLGTVYLRSQNQMMARMRDYLVICVCVTVLALFTAWLLVRRLGHTITTPIDAITNIAREVVARRDYSRRAPRISEDEAAELVDSFNAMLTEIEQRTRALEDSNREIAREAQERARAQQEVMRLNEGLEARVQERTAQLELANSELELAIEEARNANQAKSAFLSSMSHELRTPLNAILGFAQILASNDMPTTPEQKQEFAGHILKSGRHLLTLINEILDLAKVEAGAVSLSMEPVPLADVLAECRGMIAPLAATRGVRVLFPEAPTARVQADRTRLKQVLLNLLSNAVKYNRDGGAVVVDCAQPAPQRLRLSVQDTGMGLSPEQVAGLFQPFNRLGQEAGTQEGTGIGLVVTRRLVELMGGEIGVTSSPGVGSVFWIELACVDLGAATAPEAPPAAHVGAGPVRADGASAASPATVLYIEDNPANLKLVQEIVRFRPDLRLVCAPDGHFGLSLARSQLPDVILMDLNLPGLSGFEVLAQLRREPDTARIPAIAVSANAMRADIDRALAAGFARYLTKPIDIGQFNEAIDGVLATRAVDEKQPQ